MVESYVIVGLVLIPIVAIILYLYQRDESDFMLGVIWICILTMTIGTILLYVMSGIWIYEVFVEWIG